jgi:hypothetical protein
MTRKNHPAELAQMLSKPQREPRLQVIDLDDGRTIQHITRDEITQLNNRGKTITRPNPCQCRKCQ